VAAKNVVLFHSAFGRTTGVLQTAQRLRLLGHTVHTPDLYDGEVFGPDDRMEAVRKIQEVGFDGVLARSAAAVSQLSSELVYAGYSNGAACAELLAATRPGAVGAILMHGPLPIRDLGWKSWPKTVPVQVHFAAQDPRRRAEIVAAFAGRVQASGASFEICDYPGAGHLFADPDMPEYDPDAAEIMLTNVLRFLDSIDAS
jgi:dienelactone hydrolase